MLRNFENITVKQESSVLRIWLNRPHKRNAINEAMMDELIEVFGLYAGKQNIRVVVLSGKGNDFCAGADLDWMRETQKMGGDDLTRQNLKLQKVFQLWNDFPAFTLAHVFGNVVGGGLGLAAASDLLAADPDTRFRFSEVRLGLIPATIAPFVLKRTSSRFIRNAMLTAQEFDTTAAIDQGFADEILFRSNVEQRVQIQTNLLEKTDYTAVSMCKKLIYDIDSRRIENEISLYTARLLTNVRMSPEAKERIALFFESQKKSLK